MDSVSFKKMFLKGKCLGIKLSWYGGRYLWWFGGFMWPKLWWRL